MEIIFRNQMCKVDKQEHHHYAQVWIGEKDGLWRLGWQGLEPEQESESEGELWYEGISWQDLLTQYREQLKIKLAEGFHPWQLKDKFPA